MLKYALFCSLQKHLKNIFQVLVIFYVRQYDRMFYLKTLGLLIDSDHNLHHGPNLPAVYIYK